MVYPRNAPFQQLYPHGVWVIFLKTKKLDKEAKKEKEKGDKTIPPLKRDEIRSSNKKTRDVLSVSPFPPSPLNIFAFHKIGI